MSDRLWQFGFKNASCRFHIPKRSKYPIIRSLSRECIGVYRGIWFRVEGLRLRDLSQSWAVVAYCKAVLFVQYIFGYGVPSFHPGISTQDQVSTESDCRWMLCYCTTVQAFKSEQSVEFLASCTAAHMRNDWLIILLTSTQQ